MEQVIKIIQEWPIIIQGALGSALFALILHYGQKTYSYFSESLTFYSKQNKKRKIHNQLYRLHAIQAKDKTDQVYYAVVLLYRASRSFIKGFIWLTMGLIMNSFFDFGVLSIVGYCGCLYYLFDTLDIVKAINYNGDINQKINELNVLLNELK